MSLGADGHSSACTYRKCAHPEATEPCPFLHEVHNKPDKYWDVPECKHEWRQQFKDMPRRDRLVPDGFYCIHDPEHQKNIRTSF